MKTFSGRPPSQDESELREFIAFLREQNVRSYCEIGARHGDTFHEVMTNLPAGSFGLAVDLPGGAWGKRGTESALSSATEDLCSRGYQAEIVIGNSHALETQLMVRSYGPFDVLFIDADHTLEGVTKDWEAYRSMARIVAFHDVNGAGLKDKHTGAFIGVHKLWARICAEESNCVEFVNPAARFGIGAVLQ